MKCRVRNLPSDNLSSEIYYGLYAPSIRRSPKHPLQLYNAGAYLQSLRQRLPKVLCVSDDHRFCRVRTQLPSEWDTCIQRRSKVMQTGSTMWCSHLTGRKWHHLGHGI
jgi:hypothetical protein